MAEGAESSCVGSKLRRLYFTPMRDLLRGRITGSFDFYGQLCAVFPEPLAKHLLKIIRRTQLDRREQALVTKELVLRFGDRIHGRRSWETVQRRLGIRRAARSIRRRYKRQRHWGRRTFDKTLVTIACSPMALIVLYFCAMVFFWFSKPTLSVDYLAQLNEPALAVPEEDWAWPLYREAALDLDVHGDHTRDLIRYGRTPSYPKWGEMRVYLRSHQDEFELIVKAALKPICGLLFGFGDHYQDDDAMALYGPDDEDPANPKSYDRYQWRQYVSTLFSHSNKPGFVCMRSFSELMSSDAYLALAEEDADRFCDRVESILLMSGHVGELECLFVAMHACSIRYIGYETIVDAVNNQPEVFDEQALERLRRMLIDQANESTISVVGFRWIMLDFLQNAYTEEGLFGGWLTPEGLWLYRDTSSDEPPPNSTFMQRLKYSVVMPIAVFVLPTREEMASEIELCIERFNEDLATPIWVVTSKRGEAEVECINFLSWHYHTPVNQYYLDSIRRMHAINDALRYSALFGIEVEQYRRAHGDWPSRLGELPSADVYVDPITGEQARYIIRDGRPLLYSVGADRDDDVGRLPLHSHGDEPYEDVNLAQRWNEDEPADGDWVLYPWPDTPLVYGRTVTLPSEGDIAGYGFGYGHPYEMNRMEDATGTELEPESSSPDP